MGSALDCDVLNLSREETAKETETVKLSGKNRGHPLKG